MDSDFSDGRTCICCTDLNLPRSCWQQLCSARGYRYRDGSSVWHRVAFQQEHFAATHVYLHEVGKALLGKM